MKRKTISLFFIIIGALLVTSVSYAWVNPGLYGTNEGLDLSLVDESGNELSDLRIFNANNVYPGWSETYIFRIKNRGLRSVNYILGLHYEKSDSGADLAEVLTLKSVKGNSNSTYKFTELYDKPLQGKTTIGAGDVHTYHFTISMDEEAGNEYENLQLYVEITVTAESNVEHHEPGRNNNGNKQKVNKFEPEIEPEDIIEDEPLPIEPILDEILPDRGDKTNGIIEPEIYHTILPQTGGLPYQLLLAIGIVFIAIGCWLRKSKHITE